MEGSYVARTPEGYRIVGSRVSLDSVVHDFLSGLPPESIADNYDTLALEQVYGAITYYLAHRAEVDAYLRGNLAKFETLRAKARAAGSREPGTACGGAW
ncbi:MAG: DUF433 domain-containing protein [Acidobacteriota bacterium]